MPRKTLKERKAKATSIERDTIGSRIMARAGGGKDPDWYANELFAELQQYGGSPSIGSLCFFSYNAAYPAKYPFYDRRPLAYIIEITSDKILGANLHYLNPALRGQLASSLINKTKVDFSIGYSKLIHSYFPGNMGDMYAIPVDGNEYNDVAKLVTESFVDKVGTYVEPQAAWDSI